MVVDRGEGAEGGSSRVDMGFDDACLRGATRTSDNALLQPPRAKSPDILLHHGRLLRRAGTFSSLPILRQPCLSRFPDPAQGHPGIRPRHPHVAPSVYRLRPPRRHLCACVLLFHVRRVFLHCATPSGPTLTPNPLPCPPSLVPPSLPNEKLPARELAVASTASVLGGFGVVALFCSVGVYV